MPGPLTHWLGLVTPRFVFQKARRVGPQLRARRGRWWSSHGTGVLNPVCLMFLRKTGRPVTRLLFVSLPHPFPAVPLPGYNSPRGLRPQLVPFAVFGELVPPDNLPHSLYLPVQWLTYVPVPPSAPRGIPPCYINPPKPKRFRLVV